MFCHIRTYPVGFADRIRSLLPELVSGSEEVSCPESTRDTFTMFELMPFSTWHEAKLVQPLKYVRGNRSLRIPPKWRQAFPKPFEILHQLEEQRRAA